MSIITRSFMKIKQHPDIVPLIGAMVYSGGLSLFALGWTALRKTDVIFNRWTNKLPDEKVDWTRPTQKVLLTNSTEYEGYGPRFSEEEKLYHIIYGDGQYRARSSH